MKKLTEYEADRKAIRKRLKFLEESLKQAQNKKDTVRCNALQEVIKLANKGLSEVEEAIKYLEQKK